MCNCPKTSRKNLQSRIQMKNLSYLYYKRYFDEIPVSYLLESESGIPESAIKTIRKRNKELLNEPLFVIPRNGLENSCINAKVAYPGLITGIGLTHEVGIEGEFKLGMHFDYTYGMPVIYGSSIKGLLRSAFPDEKDSEEVSECKKRQIHEYLGKNFERIDVNKLRDILFEGKSDNMIPISHRDIFFDAAIIQSEENNNRILESDSITPHGNNPLKNPNPITFLKIAAGATLEFRFKFVESKIDNVTLTVNIKNHLFRQILEDFGAGAKTNVGYGQFSEVKCS